MLRVADAVVLLGLAAPRTNAMDMSEIYPSVTVSAPAANSGVMPLETARDAESGPA